MPADSDVDVVRSIYAAINRHDAAAQAALFAPGMVRHDLTAMIANAEGGQAVGNFLQMLRGAMPDLHMELEDAFSDGHGRVAARVTLTGTHEGEFLGAAPTGAQVSFAAITLYRIENGQAAEAWSLVDWSGALRQMGASTA
jgi:steroid delta-isomerase-like uncharacterized protein